MTIAAAKCDRCEAFDAALNRLNSLYRGCDCDHGTDRSTLTTCAKCGGTGEPQEPSTEELAATVLEGHRTEAREALSELVIRAQGHVPVEALAASEAARDDWKLHAETWEARLVIAQAALEQVEKERDEWRHEAQHLVSTLRLANKNTERRGADRDRLTAALEQARDSYVSLLARFEAIEEERDRIARKSDQLATALRAVRDTEFGTGFVAFVHQIAREALNPGDGREVIVLPTVRFASTGDGNITPVAECLACGHVVPLAVWTDAPFHEVKAGLCAPCRDAAEHLRGACSAERGCRCEALNPGDGE